MTIRKPIMIAAMSLTIAAGQPTTKPAAAAPRAAPATTINCLLASNVFAQRETDANKKNLAHETLLFYLGRLDPRTTSSQLKTQLQGALGALKSANAVLLMNDCLSELRAKAKVLQSVGQLQPPK